MGSWAIYSVRSQRSKSRLCQIKISPFTQDIMDILIVAAPHDQIFKLVEIVETAGLNCTHLDVNSFALANTYMANYGPTEEKWLLFLTLGRFIPILWSYETDIIFCRIFPLEGRFTPLIFKGNET